MFHTLRCCQSQSDTSPGIEKSFPDMGGTRTTKYPGCTKTKQLQFSKSGAAAKGTFFLSRNGNISKTNILTGISQWHRMKGKWEIITLIFPRKSLWQVKFESWQIFSSQRVLRISERKMIIPIRKTTQHRSRNNKNEMGHTGNE